MQGQAALDCTTAETMHGMKKLHSWQEEKAVEDEQPKPARRARQRKQKQARHKPGAGFQRRAFLPPSVSCACSVPRSLCWAPMLGRCGAGWGR